MNITGLVAVSGKPGLFKLVGQNKSGFILEGLDAQKLKLVVNLSTSKLASLEDITIYCDDEDRRLKDIFEAMKVYSKTIPSSKEDAKVLRAFFADVVPDHDQERVYTSDIKKIVNWFSIIKELPLFDEEEPATETQAEEAKVEVVEESAKEEATEKKTKKPAAKKISAKKD